MALGETITRPQKLYLSRGLADIALKLTDPTVAEWTEVHGTFSHVTWCSGPEEDPLLALQANVRHDKERNIRGFTLVSLAAVSGSTHYIAEESTHRNSTGTCKQPRLFDEDLLKLFEDYLATHEQLPYWVEGLSAAERNMRLEKITGSINGHDTLSSSAA